MHAGASHADAAPAPERCPNCSAPVQGPYCAACGQAVDVDPHTLGYWLRGFVSETLALDGALPRSLRALLARPGRLTAEWRAGRRASWTHPVRLYLVCSIAFFTVSLVVPSEVRFTVGEDFAPDPAMRSAQYEAQQRALATVAPQALVVLVPVLALLLRMAFGTTRYYVEHLVHALHLQSFLFVLMLAAFVPDVFPGSSGLAQLLALPAGFGLYLVASARRVYGVGLSRALIGTTAVSVAFLISAVLVMAAAVTLFASDPSEARTAAEERYWSVRALDTADGSDARARARAALTAHRRLEVHLVGSVERAHAAELALLADSVSTARSWAEQGLAAAPDHPLLLRVAAMAAQRAGDTAEAVRLRARFLSVDRAGAAADPALEAHRADLEAFGRALPIADSGAGAEAPAGSAPGSADSSAGTEAPPGLPPASADSSDGGRGGP